MGWLLKSKKRRTRRRTAAAKRTISAVLLYRLLIVAAVVVFGGLVVIGWDAARRHLLDETAGRYPPTASAEHVVLEAPPPWLDRLVRQQLRDLTAAQLHRGAVDHEGLDRAVAAVGDNAWVRRVEKIRRGRHGQVIVSAEYRKPTAAVETPDGYFRVDAHCVQLPGLFLPAQLKDLGLPVIYGVSAPPPGDGQSWQDEQLDAAMSLTNALRRRPYTHQIVGVQATEPDRLGRARLAIVTQRGLVKWGLGPGGGYALEPDTDVKLGRLMRLYRQQGSIDAGGQIVDLSGPAVYIQRRQSDDAVEAGYRTGP